MKKRFLQFVSLLLIISLMTACGGNPSGSNPSVSDAASPSGSGEQTGPGTADNEFAEWGAAMKERYGGTTINALLASHPSTTAMLEMIDDFTALTGIKVNTRVLASTEMKTMQRSNSSTKTGIFDVYMVDAFTVYEYAKAGYIENLEGYLNDPVMTPEWYDYEDILLAFRDGIASVDGEAYLLPVAGESRFVAYRTDLFEEHGKKPPETLDEWLELCQYFQEAGNGEYYGISFRGAAGTLVGSAHMAVAYCFSDTPIIDPATGKYQLDSPESVQSIQYILDLAKCSSPDIASMNHEDSAALFAQGKCAMWFDATSLAYMVEDPASSTVAGNVGYFDIPSGPAGESGAVAGWSLGIPTDSQNKEAAYAFSMYMTSRGTAKTYNLAGGVPCRTSVFEDPEILAMSPSNTAIFSALNTAGELAERGVTYNYPSINVLSFMAVIGNEINRAEVGEITAQQAAENAQRQIEAILAEQSA